MFRLVVKLFGKMLRSKSFTLLLISLAVATASITAISIFVERINNTLYSEAAEFIAADAKVQGSMPAPQEWYQIAKKNELDVAQTTQFSAMIFAQNAMQLARIKAVSTNYPLRGSLQIRDAANQEVRIIGSGPTVGKLWLAPRLFTALNIRPGTKVKVGDAEFIAEKIIVQEPDSVGSTFAMAPRAMIHIDDVDATGAIQLGSRVNHDFMLAGDPQAIDAAKTQIYPQLGEHYRWVSPEEGSAAFSSALDRAKRFLLLAGSLSVLLASVAIALAAHHFAAHQQTQVALLKTFGIGPKGIQQFYLLLLILTGCTGFIFGSTGGWLLHQVIVALLADLFPQDLASAGTKPYIIGAITCSVTLFAFASPPLLTLKSIAPAQILRQEKNKGNAILISVVCGVLATALLIGFYSLDIYITAILFGAMLLCVAASALTAKILLKLTKTIQNKLRGYWRVGLSNLQRQKQFTALQIFVFASVVLLVAVLSQLRTSLVEQWQPQMAETPNHFVFNIFHDELALIQNTFSEAEVNVSEYYPMSRGRVVKINGQSLKERIIPDMQRSDYERELNLTWSETLGKDNRIDAGAWWPDDRNSQLSVSAEYNYALGLGLKLGDTITFSVAGREFSAELKSIRRVKWDSMNPNFYMIFDRPIADNFAANWITSFYLPSSEKAFLNKLLADHPTISLIELDQTIAAVQEILNHVTMAIEFILMLVLGASILVMLTSIQATVSERRRESALLRSFGANRSFVQQVLIVEFASIGLLAGIFASAGAEACLYFVQVKLFEFEPHIHWQIWAIAPALTTVLVAAIGYAATVGVTHETPLHVLRTQTDET